MCDIYISNLNNEYFIKTPIVKQDVNLIVNDINTDIDFPNYFKKNVKIITFENIDILYEMAFIFETFPNITVFCIDNYDSLTNIIYDLNVYLQFFPNVSTLEMFQICADNFNFLNTFPNIKSVLIDCNYINTDTFLNFETNNVETLQVLNIYDFCDIDINSLSNLTTLYIHNVVLTDDFINNLNSLKKLLMFEIEDQDTDISMFINLLKSTLGKKLKILY